MNADAVQLTEDGAVPAEGAGRRAWTRGLGFAETWRALKRRKLTIILTTILGALVAVIVMARMTPQYAATATVMLDARESNVVDVEEVLSGLPADDDTVNSEILVIRSPVLAARVARDLGLAERVEFNPALADGPGLLDFLDGFDIRGWFVATPTASRTEEARISALHGQVMDAVLERLTVARVGRSRALEIKFVSGDPEIAAQFVNGLADAYLADQLAAKYEATEQAQSYLDDRVADLRQKVLTAERRIEQFRAQAGITGAGDRTVAAEQLSGLNTQLVLARAKRAEAEARLAQTRRLAQSGQPEAAAEVLASPLIVDLRVREASAEQQVAELSQEYGDRHPRMIGARAELDDIRQAIGSEVAKIVTALANEVAVARARESTLSGNVANLQTTAADQGVAEAQARSLEREADAARALFQEFLVRASETETQTEIQRPDARVLARADAPSRPAYPDPAVILPIAVGLSLLIGMALALMQEQLDDGYRSGEDLELDLGASVLALIPQVKRRRLLRKRPDQYAIDRPESAYAESLRSIDTGLRLSNVAQSPRSVLLTSALPDEGKSTLALSMGRLLAKGGRPVLVVEADMRRPRIARTLGLTGEGGLVEVLLGEVSEHDVIQEDPESGLHVMAAGGRDVASPPNLLGSEPMGDLLSRLETHYDLVIIDTAPLLVVSDGRAMARHADAVILLVRWATTKREIARTALRQLRDAGANLAGLAMTSVDVKRLAQYAYGGSRAYAKAAKKYYQD